MNTSIKIIFTTKGSSRSQRPLRNKPELDRGPIWKNSFIACQNRLSVKYLKKKNIVEDSVRNFSAVLTADTVNS